jgi:DNA ligase (NAD+)
MVDEPTDNPYIHDPDLDFVAPDELTPEAAEREVELLRTALSYHDHRYYVANDPVASDRTYDRLFDRLETLESAFDLSDPTSPTQRVGGEPLDELETVAHVAPLRSLDSSEEAADVRAFDRRVRAAVGDVRYSVEPKFDGFSIELVYEDGRFERAVTRGNGREGEDVTANVRTIRSVPLRLQDAPERLAVRGEIYMPRSGFQDLNERRIERGDDPFDNPRNAAAGSVRLLDPSTVAERPLDVFCYDVLDASVDLDSQAETFELLRSVGLRVCETNAFVDDVDGVVDYRNARLDERDDLEYEIDGVVAKVDDVAAREELGTTARHPNWAYAYKFPPKTDETTVERIVVQVGRTGKLTPVALLSPVDLHGVTVSRASLHNAAQVRRLGVAPGARVTIRRAGDVIPEVVAVLDGADGDFEMPDACPVCGSDVVREGEHHFCTGGTTCPAQLARSVEHFCSRPALDVEGVGSEVAERLVEEGPVGSVADLFDLTTADLAELEGFGETSASNLVSELDASTEPTLSSFVYALGIRHVGSERARALARAFDLDSLMHASESELLAVDDVGPEVAVSVRSFFDNEDNRETIERLLDAGVSPRRETVETDATLDGLTLAVTGSVDDFTRGELTEELQRRGADVTSSVSGATDVLLVGENPGRRKRDDADAEGVPEADAETFLRERTDLAP